MIKLFRRIRRQFIAEGNLWKFFSYALGEILLIVIGILIALQISNWNNKELAAKKELALLHELKRNLNTNLKSIQSSIQMDKIGAKSSEIVENMFIEKWPFSDTIGQHIINTGYNEKLNIVSSAYTTIRSIGLDILTNDSIRESTINLFELEYPGLVEQTYNVRLLQFQEIFLPKYNKYFRFKDGIVIIDDYDALLRDIQFLNTISSVKDWKGWSISLKEASADNTNALITLIDKEINK